MWWEGGTTRGLVNQTRYGIKWKNRRFGRGRTEWRKFGSCQRRFFARLICVPRTTTVESTMQAHVRVRTMINRCIYHVLYGLNILTCYLGEMLWHRVRRPHVRLRAHGGNDILFKLWPHNIILYRDSVHLLSFRGVAVYTWQTTWSLAGQRHWVKTFTKS